jgi:Protein of unknown function (DUF2723)
MNSFRKINNLVGWAVFLVTATVYYLSAERTGSLWDCGEFVSGAYKMQVVHPPGAPFFLMIGKVATLIGQMFSKDPSVIAFSVNVLSGICSALAAMFICWTTVMLGKIALVGRDAEPSSSETIALMGAGVVSGLTTAFATSIWFSAVEGEVYSMSTMFTTLTLWCMIKWYYLPNTPQADRWMIAAVYAAGVSTGVHLLSLLTFPALALFYYFKKTEKPTFGGMAIAGIVGILFISVIQKLIITGIPALWGNLEYACVNWIGLPFTIPSLILTIAIISGLTYWGLKLAHQRKNSTIQNIVLGLALTAVSFSTIGTVLIRANANPPINMNNPSDPLRVIPYLNREQYGERPLLYGPQFNARPVDQTSEDRYGRVGDKYEVVDHKTDYVFNDADKVLFPRMGHYEGDRLTWYKRWLEINPKDEVPSDRPSSWDNTSFFLRYQVGWMYWRYFMWNFVGRQNAEQGFEPSNKANGNWLSGVSFIDNMRLFDAKNQPTWMKEEPSTNKYYFLPFIFGLFGLIWHYSRKRYDMLGLMALFIITGIGIIVYTNEPPNEPRERDYVIVGSIFTFAIWVGMGVLAAFDLFKDFKLAPSLAAPLAAGLVVIAPIIMGVQNFDDHSRAKHTGARDYANNFLESCDKNAIIFTYGDNDTYPLWYAQEVEGIRTDVRVVNLSLIAVDWYIDNLRRKINKSDAIKMSLNPASYRGFLRNQLPVQDSGGEIAIQDLMKHLGEDHPVPAGNGVTFESFAQAKKIYVPVDKEKMLKNGIITAQDTGVVDKMAFTLPGNYVIKDDLAVLDIIANNANERPIYFAVTCRPEKMQGLDDYMQLEGLALRLVPVKSQGERQFSLIGSGRVEDNKVYDRVMNKFRWGNFDKEKTFINRSYQPSVQTTQFVILRAALDLAKKGDKDRAVKLLDKNFEAFPNFNFPYNAQTMYFIDAYVQAGAYENSKKHIKILAQNLFENLTFYNSLKQEDKRGTFQNDFMQDLQTKEQLIKLVEQMKDTAYKAELDKKFEAFKIETILPQMQ